MSQGVFYAGKPTQEQATLKVVEKATMSWFCHATEWVVWEQWVPHDVTGVVHHMAIHSCESDFRMICGIDSCTASIQRYSGYKKHVYHAHGNNAGVATTTSSEGTARNDDAAVKMHSSITDSESARNSKDSDNANDNSEESPSGGCTANEIQKQLLLFYLKITEK